MEAVNCLRCEYKDADNGNCTAAGGFCTAVQAAHCPLLRQYLGTRMTPEQVKNAKTIIESAFAEDTSKAERIRKLLAADKAGRVVVLPCKGYSDIGIVRNGILYKPDHWNIHLTAYAHGQNTPSGIKVGLFDIGEVERALQEMEGKKDG
jgi:hypothetical protein